ncbi:MAG: hypothetical protein AAFR11_10755 [Pseudomonadota bacterium]
MRNVVKFVLAACGLLFVMIGAAWFVAPAFAADLLGMGLFSGVGLSSQIADLASFFLTVGTCILLGLMSGNRGWFYPAIMLLGFAVAGRLVAWLAHGAALTVDMIVVEVVTMALLYGGSGWLERPKS